MSIFNGVAGNRGHNPIGAVIHNDAGSQNANASYYQNWLPGINPENGFAHDYVCSDGTVHAEDDWNCAWHCGDGWGNNEFYSVEVCQSMGDVNVFKANEERALALVASKFKAWGITPNNDTVRLHQEFFATSCPHRSVEIHGGADATKQYFIRRISELMNSTDKWVKDAKGWWYRWDDGSYPKEQWLKLAGEWYYFDSYGYAIQNQWRCIKGLWYYFNDKCKMVRGFLKDGDYWYFLNRKAGSKPEGAMLTGFVLDGTEWYFFRRANDGHPLGSMVTGLFDDGDYKYYCRPKKEGKYAEGTMVTGFQWVDSEKAWYYFNKDKNCQPIGSMMCCHWIVENGKRYYLKDDGKMACNEIVVLDGKEYRFDASGALKA